MFGERTLYADRAPDGLVRIRERNEEPVAGMRDFYAAMLGKELAERIVVPLEQIAPGFVAYRIEEVRRPHDVGEKERLCDSPFGLSRWLFCGG